MTDIHRDNRASDNISSDNWASVVFGGLAVCMALALIVYLIG